MIIVKDWTGVEIPESTIQQWIDESIVDLISNNQDGWSSINGRGSVNKYYSKYYFSGKNILVMSAYFKNEYIHISIKIAEVKKCGSGWYSPSEKAMIV